MLTKLIDLSVDQTPPKKVFTKLKNIFCFAKLTLLKNLKFSNCDKIEENSKR